MLASGQHFEQHAAERPDVGAAVDRRAASLFRAHVGAVPMTAPSRVASVDAVARVAVETVSPWPGRNRAPSTSRRAVILMLAGLRSRWMMPCSCAASSAAAIWRPDDASARGSCAADEIRPACRPRRTPSRARSCHRLGELVERGYVGMIQRGERPRLAANRARLSG